MTTTSPDPVLTDPAQAKFAALPADVRAAWDIITERLNAVRTHESQGAKILCAPELWSLYKGWLQQPEGRALVGHLAAALHANVNAVTRPLTDEELAAVKKAGRDARRAQKMTPEEGGPKEE